MFKQVTESSAPPTPGAAIEHLSLDFKRQLDPDIKELAKDVAAFANAVGGVIWVGVDEDKATRRVGSYYPLTTEQAERARVLYQEAASKKCSPSPVIDTIPIAVTDGLLVAVNVWPFPGQAVGWEVADQAYKFPVRVGTQTTYLQAEQLPMLMVPELRRVAIHLSAIKPGEKVILHDEKRHKTAMLFREVRIMENVAVFEKSPDPDASRTDQRVACVLPMDQIISIWRDASGDWRIVAKYSWTASAGALLFSAESD